MCCKFAHLECYCGVQRLGSRLSALHGNCRPALQGVAGRRGAAQLLLLVLPLRSFLASSFLLSLRPWVSSCTPGGGHCG